MTRYQKTGNFGKMQNAIILCNERKRILLRDICIVIYYVYVM